MGTPAAIGVDDDLTPGQAGVSVWPADAEAARGVEVEDGLVVQVLSGHDSLDHVLHQVSADLLVRDVGRVLGGDEDGVHADGLEDAGDHGVTFVLHSHLRGAGRGSRRRK